MKNNLGLGVMINMLSGNAETVTAIQSSIGKKIQGISLEESERLIITFTDNSKLTLWDAGQSCCEHRYMTTADKLNEFVGADLVGFELKEAPAESCDYGDHEVQFLDVKTSLGVFQMANHNEHNGWYGGFSVVARCEA